MIQVFSSWRRDIQSLLGQERGETAAPVRALIDALDFKVA